MEKQTQHIFLVCSKIHLKILNSKSEYARSVDPGTSYVGAKIVINILKVQDLKRDLSC